MLIGPAPQEGPKYPTPWYVDTYELGVKDANDRIIFTFEDIDLASAVVDIINEKHNATTRRKFHSHGEPPPPDVKRLIDEDGSVMQRLSNDTWWWVLDGMGRVISLPPDGDGWEWDSLTAWEGEYLTEIQSY